MNRIFLTGNLCKDPESKTLPNGTNLCTFTVAVNQIKGDVQYFRVTAWRQLAENCQRFLTKGRKVAVIGSVSLNTYKKASGEAGASMEVNADQVEFLSPKEQGDADDSGLTYTPPKVDGKSGMVVIDDEEILPF